ncbi:MAG: penicillin-binding protein 2 [Bacteroidales bacterium]|nr:penicillin-binding protein 2 [Bacteroidales bacterium]
MKQFKDRRIYISGIFLIIFISILLKLFWIQIIDTSYKTSSDNNSQRKITKYPGRGLIYDRNNKLLVGNEIAYDIMIIPRQTQSFDTSLLVNDLGIEIEDIRSRIEKAKKYSVYKPSLFYKQLSRLQYAYFQEHMYRLSGFYVQPRFMRKYEKSIAAHILGDVGEIDQVSLEKDTFYTIGDYVGRSGIEKYYEKQLRGFKGTNVFIVDVHNRIQGSYMGGKYDKEAIPGQDIILCIDSELQEYGELLMVNKIGSIVAIEPSSGEILALVSSPSFDPSLLVGRSRGSNYDSLLNAANKPLYNRAVGASYPPGSIFKMVQAVIGLDQEVITENTSFPCDRSTVGCHNHPPNSNLKRAIQYSCNPYFYALTKRLIQRGFEKSIFRDSRIGLEIWKDKVLNFGFEQAFDIGLPGVSKGKIPGPDYYDRLYGQHRWAYSTIYSLSIGQGEVLVSPLQMANLAAIIANKGYYYIPHIAKNIGSKNIDSIYLKPVSTSFDSKHFISVVDGMEAVVNEEFGTGRLGAISGIKVCGKTGTAQNPHGADHSIFMAFAPKENPKIAIAVYVENAGFGGTWAAPIASLMMEKYLKDSVSNIASETRILNAKFN